MIYVFYYPHSTLIVKVLINYGLSQIGCSFINIFSHLRVFLAPFILSKCIILDKHFSNICLFSINLQFKYLLGKKISDCIWDLLHSLFKSSTRGQGLPFLAKSVNIAQTKIKLSSGSIIYLLDLELKLYCASHLK